MLGALGLGTGLRFRRLGPSRALSLWLALASSAAASSASADEGIEFFEKNVRPVLVEHCYSCHSQTAEKVKGGLLLDTREGLRKGGQSGPALVPGDPEHSLLIQAVRYTNADLQMPPKGKKLASDQVKTLEEWVRMGAPDPRTSSAANAPVAAPASGHWAFQPIRTPAIPAVQNSDWVQTPVDAFILAKLESKRMAPSRRADKRTLLRRATFDVTGLPPTPGDMRAFLSDGRADAFEKVVDRLLASPRYGERWGRHWLDVARYADTKGYVFEEERRYPYAYTYRDYVIRAFNDDLPFDQFVIQQLAADQLPLGEDKRPLAALGYLTLGRRFLNNQHDIIDDRIDVVTRGMMGLTVSCARCHDHKFDPITARDYYSLYGVFANSSEPEEKPALGGGVLPPKYAEYQTEHQRRLSELNQFRETKSGQIRTQLRRTIGEYMLAARDINRLPDGSRGEGLARERKLDPRTAQRWREKLAEWREGAPHPILAPWLALTDCSDEEMSPEEMRQRTESVLKQLGSAVNPLVAHRLAEPAVTSVREIAERYNLIATEVDQVCAGDAGAKLDDLEPCIAEIRELLYGSGSPVQVPEGEITKLYDVPSIQRLRALKRKVEELDATHPGAPPRAMVLQDNATPRNSRVLIRGNPSNPGPEVPRQFVAVLCGGAPTPFKHGSGRLELAQSIASRDNPLTARVFVNRVWLHYFGAGLVRTPSDFGMRSEPPSHPELLDYLAARFMDQGWSIKKLHREILLSSTYQQASDENPRYAAADPSNQWLWRMNRRRLDLESARDSLLAVADSLDLSMGGHSVDIVSANPEPRRTVYGFVERQNLPGLFRTFDFATPDTTSPQRFSTTVPQQALFMLNSPFVVQQARNVARQLESNGSCEERVQALYQRLYQRDPSAEELALGARFVDEQAHAPAFVPPAPAWQYGYGEYDPERRRVCDFQPLPHFTGDAWQGSAALPDPKLGWVQLKAAGGHPGNDHQHAAVLRWIAPRATVVSISGALSHPSDKGDGVQAWIVSSRSGELGTWSVRKGKESTRILRLEVQEGETIDFVVDCGGSVDSDGFTWAPAIRSLDEVAGAGDETVRSWDARQDFKGRFETPTPLGPWERYAQVLLMSNELVFVD